MELKKGEITSYSSANILKNYLFILKRLYKDYSYLGIEHNKFNKMVLDEIELSKNEYDGSVLYSVYLKERLNKYLLAYINNLMKEEVNAFKIINNYINLNFNGPKTDDYVLYYLTKLDEFFSNLDYIPEPDTLINIVNSNLLLKRTIEVYVNNKLFNKKVFNSNSYGDNVVMLIIDTYCELHDIHDNKINNNDIYDDKNIAMNTDSVRFYFDEIKNIPPLTVKEEKKYGYELLNGSEEARNILIKHNLKLVVAIAKKYIGLGVSFIDMIQDGNEGLLISIDKFDPSKGCLFSTYAAWWIRLRITRAIAANKSTIRVPLHDNDKNKNYQIALDKLSNELNRVPTDSEIAKFMNITIDEIKRIKAYQIEIISLNTLIGNDKENELSEVVSLTEDTPEDITIINNLPNDVRRLLDNCHLTEREISVLALRYGLDGQNPRTLEEVGIILGNVSKERTRQLEARALKKIRMSAYIKDFAIYMNNPSKAIKRIDDYREQYEESIFNTYKLNIIDDNTKAKNVVKECKTKVRR